MSKTITSERTKKVFALLQPANTIVEASSILAENFPQLSSQAAANVVQDIADFSNQKMELSELDYRIEQAGL